MTFRVEIAPRALREVRKLEAPSRRRIQAALELLATDPRPPAATQLVGGSGEWRIRTGDFRVIYEIHDHELVLLARRIEHRRDVYRR